MGHTGHLKEEYQELLRRLDAGQVGMPEPSSEEARAGRREILEILYTPLEAEIASRLPVKPAKLNAIADRVGISPRELRPLLDAMCDKGVVIDLVHPRTGVVRYALSPPVVGFFEFSLMRIGDSIPKKRMAEALHAYTHGDPAFAEHVFGGDTVVGRAMVREDRLFEDMPDVLPWERASAIVDRSNRFAVSMCYCRHKAEHLGEDCDAPKEICLSLGVGAEFVARRGFGKEIDKSEALSLLETARDAGLVQIADNVRNQVSYICNCCGCCCGQLMSINSYGLRGVNPSGFEPSIREGDCSGCSACARACPVKAIVMEPARRAAQPKNQLLPRIDHELCIGCGVCAGACRKDVMRMTRAAQQPHVPANAIERIVRMAIERGNVAHLIVDEGASRGHKFLNAMLQALTRLPPAQRVLASEQIKSRFVAFALETVPDPTGAPKKP